MLLRPSLDGWPHRMKMSVELLQNTFASAEKMRREMRACGAYESYGEADAAFFAMPAFCCSLQISSYS